MGTQAPDSKTSSEAKGGIKWLRDLVCPSREGLHSGVRLALGVLANVVLAMWVLPQLGHVTDPEYAPINAIRVCLEVLGPCTALVIMVPVFVFGRDIPRLLAIGLSFLPAYIAFAGFCDATSLWLSGR
jgi:hypothetical protein